MQVLLFTWLHNQEFYISLQKKAVEPFSSTASKNNKLEKTWADIGCSTGLLSRLAAKLNYTVTGYDIDKNSLKMASFLSRKYKNLSYEQKDFNTLNESYDVISATSLLSVVPKKEESLKKLISLLRDADSTLVLIEPTSKLTRKNVWKNISDLKSFCYYKGLLLWAKARENKAIDYKIFDSLQDITFTKEYHLDEMISITYVQKT